MSEDNIETILVPLWDKYHDRNDLYVSKYIKSCGANCTIQRVKTRKDIYLLLRKSQFCISFKLHGIIYSALTKVPFLGVNYNIKVRSFIKTINKSYCVEPENVTYKTLMKYYRKRRLTKNDIQNIEKEINKSKYTFQLLDTII